MRQTNEMCEHLSRLGKFPKEKVWMSMLNIPKPVKRGIRSVTKFDMMFILDEFEAIGDALINHLMEFQKKLRIYLIIKTPNKHTSTQIEIDPEVVEPFPADGENRELKEEEEERDVSTDGEPSPPLPIELYSSLGCVDQIWVSGQVVNQGVSITLWM
jgi:hypothetical protein